MKKPRTTYEALNNLSQAGSALKKSIIKAIADTLHFEAVLNKIEKLFPKYIAGSTIKPGDAVSIKPRTWKARLFSLPWRPFTKYELMKIKVHDHPVPLKTKYRTIKEHPDSKFGFEVPVSAEIDFEAMDRIGLQAAEKGAVTGKLIRNLEIEFNVIDNFTPVIKRIIERTFRILNRPYRHMWE